MPGSGTAKRSASVPVGREMMEKHAQCNWRNTQDNEKPDEAPLALASSVSGLEERRSGTSSTPFSGSSGSRHFKEDLQQWVFDASEIFHARIFAIELLGQTLYALLGPFCWPVQIWLYGGVTGLKNRGFWPTCSPIFFMQFIVWLLLFTSLGTYVYYRPPEIMAIEFKFFVSTLAMRYSTIAVKYGYMTSVAWKRMNTELVDQEYFANLLIGSWATITPCFMKLQAEISFVGIIGSREQRSGLSVRFYGWPKNKEDLVKIRQLIDATSKTLYSMPTGDVQEPKFWGPRTMKTVHRTNSNGAEVDSTSEASQSIEFGKCYVTKELAEQEDRTGSKMCTARECDDMIFSAAAEGHAVPVEDLFLYMLRGLLRSQRKELPLRGIGYIAGLIAIGITMTPSILRAARGEGFLGGSVASGIVVVGMWPMMLLGFSSVILFVKVGAVDMWRRRAMMRSCAALLSFQHYYRHCAVPEVKQLPVLNLCDPHTVEAFRKLRQLCNDFGQFYFLRIQAFITILFICSLIIVADMLAGMQIYSWTLKTGFNLADLIVGGTQACVVLFCIFIYVHLGHEVNDSALRHSFLLTRHRTLLISKRHRDAFDAHGRGEADPADDECRERIADFLEVLADDITKEHLARPVKLFGFYCGYSLLSALYFIPASVVASTIRFCSHWRTDEFCTVFGG